MELLFLFSLIPERILPYPMFEREFIPFRILPTLGYAELRFSMLVLDIEVV